VVNFVLVHGGWHGGWAYQRLARLLRSAGHEVYTPTLTGLGDRHHLACMPINLETHITDVQNLIVYESLSEVILVGHSYGGMVVTGVADRIADRVATLVYLDALVPKSGDTLFSLRPEYQTIFLTRAAAGEGRLIAPPAASRFDARSEFWPLIDANTTPHPLACFTQALTLTGAHERVKQRLYIYATGGIFDGSYERFKGNGVEIYEVAEAGHTIMLDQPEDVCRILIDSTKRGAAAAGG
jgi:pimeloyl-ACP methyl ester carboxylesterase